MPRDTWSTSAWRSRAFDGFRDLLDAFGDQPEWPTLCDMERRWLVHFNTVSASGSPLHLIQQPSKLRRSRPRSRGELYDVSVYNGQLPTRAHNWHDFFNVLMFVAFTHTKQALHRRHCEILEQLVPEQIEHLPGARTRERDDLAMLDEGGVILAVGATSVGSLRDVLGTAEHDRLRSAIDLGAVRPWLIGHAHLEHLAISTLARSPAPLPRAKPILLDVGAGATRKQVDEALATQLERRNAEWLRNGWRAVSLEHLYPDLTSTG